MHNMGYNGERLKGGAKRIMYAIGWLMDLVSCPVQQPAKHWSLMYLLRSLWSIDIALTEFEPRKFLAIWKWKIARNFVPLISSCRSLFIFNVFKIPAFSIYIWRARVCYNWHPFILILCFLTNDWADGHCKKIEKRANSLDLSSSQWSNHSLTVNFYSRTSCLPPPPRPIHGL